MITTKLAEAKALFEKASKQGGDETSIRQIADGLALLADALLAIEKEKRQPAINKGSRE